MVVDSSVWRSASVPGVVPLWQVTSAAGPRSDFATGAVSAKSSASGFRLAAQLDQPYGARRLRVGAEQAVARLLVDPDVPLAECAREQHEAGRLVRGRDLDRRRAAAGRCRVPAGRGPPSGGRCPSCHRARRPRTAPTSRPPLRSTRVVQSASQACTSAKSSCSGGMCVSGLACCSWTQQARCRVNSSAASRGRRQGDLGGAARRGPRPARRGPGRGDARRSAVRTGRGARRRSARGRRTAAPRAPRGRARRRAWCRRGTPAARRRRTPRRATRRCP